MDLGSKVLFEELSRLIRDTGDGCFATLPRVMNSLSWNCRGLGNPRSVRALHDLVRRWKPKIVFLMETKSKIKRMEKIKNRIGFANGLIVPNRGRSGEIGRAHV